MIDLQNRGYAPTMEELSDYVRTPAFDSFCQTMETGLGARHALTFSGCSWEPGWNLKFRKGGKGLCTVYPREGYFTVLVVIGQAEKQAAEAMLPECSQRVRETYAQTREGNGQRWLMIDLEDADSAYDDTLRLIGLRLAAKMKKL